MASTVEQKTGPLFAAKELRHLETSSDEHELDDLDAAGLPKKYRGTAADRMDMSMLGKKQVLRVSSAGLAHRSRSLRNLA